VRRSEPILDSSVASSTFLAMAHEVERATLARYLEEHNLKHTKQRDTILDAFLGAEGHITSEEIYQQVRAMNPTIGHTTVYRTLKLLCEAGVAQERHFDDGVARYEIEHKHHDHLVCLRCGKIVEFECEVIEDAQNKIAAEHGFRLLHHRHELYGRCPSCQDDE
jgi:Fur family ferric uptake transcriptional regulator